MKDQGQNIEFGSIAEGFSKKMVFNISNIAHLGINIKDVKLSFNAQSSDSMMSVELLY